ncbi:cyclic AMP-dependent transcription factor ATF-7 isoform X3 [Mirounga angustirostris]|uniref:cyclic AMP-dependent transcription factor ATF-7 isoform X3 n=1 Tax=Mirounga angustirostris TaxID=9716 RepID=UPI00313E4288
MRDRLYLAECRPSSLPPTASFLWGRRRGQRPEVWGELGRFTNEDHLAVHKHKHEMTLKFGPARTDSVIIADQTPTPTRFLKNCEEVGLFNELASSFEHEFKKAADEEEKKAAAGPLDMSLPSTPDIKIKEEEPVEVDSSPPDSPASSPCSPPLKEKEVAPKPVVISTPTPTIVRPGSLPLHLGYDPLHPTLPSPTSVITQAPPSNRQLGSPTGSLPLVMHLANGQTMPVLPGPPVQMPSVISRLKATLTHQVSSINGGCGMVVGTASTMVTARPEQSQLLIQHPDAPSPAQPQVSPAQPTPSTGGRRRRTVDEDPDERRQRFLERNRAAASRCRQKRKLWVSSLEKKAEELTSQNIQLSNEVTLLRNEVAQLKQLLLAHKDCPVTALQKKTQGYLESPKESSEPTGSPAPVIQHSSATAPSNGLSVRSAAEAVATSVLTQMASQRTELSMPIQSHVIMTPQSQSAGR